MYVAAPYEHTSKNYVCAISKNSVERVLEKKILKGLCKMCYIQIVFGYYSREKTLLPIQIVGPLRWGH